MDLLIAWPLFALLVGILASNRGRSGVGWFFLALLISPLIAGILVLLLSDESESEVRYAEEKRCPYCAEVIRREAIKCRYCKTNLKQAL